jgi:hypothetical protein
MSSAPAAKASAHVVTDGGRDHHHGRAGGRRVGAQAAQDRQAVQPWQQAVEEHHGQLVAGLAGGDEPRLPVAGLHHPIPRVPEVVGEHSPQRRVVLDD